MENLEPKAFSGATTGQILIPADTQKEELKLLYQIVSHVDNYQLPTSLIINFDQTPSKYVQVSLMTMQKKGTTNVPISGVDNKRSITATFAFTTVLLMHIIYKGKTNPSLPRVNFLQKFSLSVNEKYYSNEKQSLKFLKDIIISPLSESSHPDKYIYEIGRRSQILWSFNLKFLAKWTVTFFVQEKRVVKY